MIKNIPPFFKNFYFLTGCFFLLWLLFFDSNDLVSQYKMDKNLKELETEVVYYEAKIKEVEQQRTSLLTNKEELEKFARETYLMKNPNEDVYVIVDKESSR